MAEQKKQAVNKKQILQEFLSLAKKNGEVKVEAIERVTHLLELSEEQQDRLYETLDKLKVKVLGVEETLPETKTDAAEEPETIEEQSPREKKRALQEILDCAKNAGVVGYESLLRDLGALGLDEKQQQQICEMLSGLGVEITGMEKAAAYAKNIAATAAKREAQKKKQSLKKHRKKRSIGSCGNCWNVQRRPGRSVQKSLAM